MNFYVIPLLFIFLQNTDSKEYMLEAGTVEEAVEWVSTIENLLSEQHVGNAHMPLLVRLRQLVKVLLCLQYVFNLAKLFFNPSLKNPEKDHPMAILTKEYGLECALSYSTHINKYVPFADGTSLGLRHSSSNLSISSRFSWFSWLRPKEVHCTPFYCARSQLLTLLDVVSLTFHKSQTRFSLVAHSHLLLGREHG